MMAAENTEPRTSEGMRRGTGRDRGEWLALLDAWGAAGREYREIADWLTGEHRISDWWAQKLIVEYEEARGLRPPGIRRDGTFEVGATKTVAVPVARLFAAFVDPAMRECWMPDAVMRQTRSEPERAVRFEWGDGASRVVASFIAQGETKSQVTVLHQRLPDADSAERTKAYWRENLVALKAVLDA